MESAPLYARAISGNNPPNPLIPAPPPEPANISLFKFLIPIILTVYGFYFFIQSPIIGISIGTYSHPFDHAMWSMFKGIGLFILAGWSYNHSKDLRKQYEASIPRVPYEEPHQMDLTKHFYERKIDGVSFDITLEYEISVQFKERVDRAALLNLVRVVLDTPAETQPTDPTPIFHHYITSKFNTFCGAYINQQWEGYLEYCRKHGDTMDKELFAQLIDKDEIEYFLTPPFAQAVYEARVPVFRFRVRTSYFTPKPEPPTHNVVIGEVIPIEEIYDGGKIPDPWG